MIFVTSCCRYQQKYQQEGARHWLAKIISKRSAAGTVHAVLVTTIARPESNRLGLKIFGGGGRRFLSSFKWND